MLKTIIAVLLVAVRSVKSIGECIYEDKFVNRNLLAGDVFAMELNQVSTGNNIIYNVGGDQAFTAEIQGTFQPNGQDNPVPGLTGAKNVVNGFQENEFAVLAAGNIVFYLKMDRYNGSLVSNQSLTLPAGPVCTNLASSTSTGKLFVVCFDADTQNLTVHRIDMVAFDLDVSTNVPQPAGKILKDNLQLLVDDYQYEKGRSSDTLVYVYEGNFGTVSASFRLVKSTDLALISGGFFSVADQTISGLASGKFTGMFFDGSRTLITTRNGDQNFLQWCYRSPVYGVYNCNPTTTQLSTGTGLIQIYFADPTLRLTTNLIVLMTDLSSLTVGNIDQSTNLYPYQEVVIYSLTNNSLQSIKSAMPANNDFYIFGPTQQDQPNLIDGIIKFDSVSQSYEQYNYPMGGTKLQFVTKNPYNTDFAKLYVFGEEVVTYYDVKRNYLIINTDDFPNQGLIEANITITCTADDGANSNASFSLYTLLQVSDNATFRVPELNAYYGQVSIPLPSDGEDIEGNGVSVTLDSTNATGLEMTLKHNQEITVNPTGVDTNLQLNNLVYVGDNTYAAAGSNKVKFYKTGISGISMNLVQFTFELDMTNLNFLDTQVDQGLSVSLYSNTQPDSAGLKNLQQAQSPVTVIRLFDLVKNQDRINPINIPFAAKKGLVKFMGTKVLVLVVGGPTSAGVQGIYYLTVDLDFPPQSASFTKILPLGNHVCPSEIAWMPRQVSSDDGYSFFVASSCLQSGMDSHIYIYQSEGNDFTKTQLKKVYDVEGTKNFKMCAQFQLINIIDYTNNQVYSFNTSETQEASYMLPLSDYNLTTILDHSCNPNDAILHIVASGVNGAKFVTYRVDLNTPPQGRVHSIVDIDPKYKYIAGTWSDITDQILVLLLGATPADYAGRLFYADGPHIYFNTNNVALPGSYAINYILNLPGLTNVTIPVSSVLNLEKQFGGVQVSLVNSTQKIPVTGSFVNLENYLLVEGAYHNVDPTVQEVVISDRISKSNQFSNLTFLFSDALFYQNYAFGWGLSNDQTQNQISLVDAVKNQVLATVTGFKFSSMDCVPKNSSHIFFFGLSPGQDSNNDKIVIIFTTDGGKNWKTGMIALFAQGYEMARFRNGPDDTFVLGMYNNQDDFRLQIVGLRLSGDQIVIGIPYSVTYFDNIAAFDFVVFPSGDIVAIVNNEYIKLAEFLWLRLSEDEVPEIDYIDAAESGLVPNVQISSHNIVFKCRDPAPGSFNILCFTSTPNAYSYVANFTVSFLVIDPNQNFLQSVNTIGQMRNIVNLVPIRADFVGNFVSVVVQNLNTNPSDTPPISYFRDPYVTLLYNLNANTRPVDEWVIPTYDVYKCLVSGDLQMQDRSKLGNLVPRLFTDFNNTLKLGINIGYSNGTYTDSVRVFNLNPLAISIPTSSNGGFSLNFFGINDAANPVAGTAIFDVKDTPQPQPTPDDPNKKPASKKTWIWVVVIVLLLVLGAVGFGVYLQNKKGTEGGEEPNINEPESTMKDNTSTGNYMKA